MSVNSSVSPVWVIDTDDQNHTTEQETVVINDLLQEFVKVTPIDVQRSMRISEGNLGHPQASDDHWNIYLSTTGSGYYGQIAYQLAHELIHFVIAKDSPSSWFEESLAELGSIVFIKRLINSWQFGQDQSKKQFVPILTKYNDILKHEPVEKHKLSDVQNKQSKLSQNLYSQNENRELNRFIAKKLLPIATIDPNFWNILPTVGLVSVNQLPIDYLIDLKSKASATTANSINQILALFS